MQRLIILMTLSLIFTACAAPTTPAPTPTVIPTGTSTSTPTPIPSATPSPTATVDPNKPSDATAIDAVSGEYIKVVVEKGKATTYYWKQIEIGGDASAGTNGHWFESRMARGLIDLTGYGENLYGNAFGNIRLPLNVYSIAGLHDLDKIGYLYHPAGLSDFIKNGDNSDTLPSKVALDLFLTYYDAFSAGPAEEHRVMEKYIAYVADKDNTQIASDWKTFVGAMNNGGSVRIGGELWQPSKGYEVLWIDEATAQQDPTMLFSQTENTKAFYWKTLVKNGKLIAVVAPGAWARGELSTPKISRREHEFRWFTLFLLQAALEGRNVKEGGNWMLSYQDYASFSGSGMSVSSPDGSFTVTTSFIALTPSP